MANVQKAIWNHDRIFIRTMTTGNLNACRAATHIYNMPGEVDRLIASVKWVSRECREGVVDGTRVESEHDAAAAG